MLDPDEDSERFRVYLVAHSMGGLICRCYLQNPSIPDLGLNASNAGPQWLRKGVDKLFTYGTPHGGIEFRDGLRFLEVIRDSFDPNNAGNFGPRRMREFLHLDTCEPLNSLNGRYPSKRVFCVVGTDWRDYRVGRGLARTVVDEMSDGLVLIKNASVRGAARAFVHRSHSGDYGLVNSESGYQNLRRFLFGDTRVLIEMTDVTVSLPPELDREKERGKKIRASYHVDTIFSVRGVPVDLHRRCYDEWSAIFRTYEQLTQGPTTLFTAFLTSRARVKQDRKSLGFALSLHVHVPRYEVDGREFEDYYERGVLFDDKLNIGVTPADLTSEVEYGWDSRAPNQSTDPLVLEREEDAVIGTIPFGDSGNRRPGIQGRIRLTVTRWNVQEPSSRTAP